MFAGFPTNVRPLFTVCLTDVQQLFDECSTFVSCSGLCRTCLKNVEADPDHLRNIVAVVRDLFGPHGHVVHTLPLRLTVLVMNAAS